MRFFPEDASFKEPFLRAPHAVNHRLPVHVFVCFPFLSRGYKYSSPWHSAGESAISRPCLPLLPSVIMCICPRAPIPAIRHHESPPHPFDWNQGNTAKLTSAGMPLMYASRSSCVVSVITAMACLRCEQGEGILRGGSSVPCGLAGRKDDAETEGRWKGAS